MVYLNRAVQIMAITLRDSVQSGKRVRRRKELPWFRAILNVVKVDV